MKNLTKPVGKLCPHVKKGLLIMRLSVLLILIAVFSSTASVYSQATRLTVKMENARLSEVFDAIEKQSEFYFFYNRDYFNDDRIVSVDVENKLLDEVLKELLKGEAITWEIFDRNILLRIPEAPLTTAQREVMQQQKAVSGKVTDESGEPLPGVTVVVKGTTQGTVTNTDGEYSLSNIPEDATLVFSFVGMRTQEVVVGDQTMITVAMMGDVIGIEEVVAIGYGTMQKKDFTGAVSQIDAEKLVNETTANMGDVLRGSVPGLNVTFNTSAKGLSSASSMVIRGETNLRGLGGNAPLIVLDGIIYEGDLSDINPLDIDRIDVLKDASSAAVFGSQGSNGVIMITTKRGKTGKPIININTSIGFVNLSHTHMKVSNGEQFIQRVKDGHEGNQKFQIEKPGYYNNPNELPEGVLINDWKAYDGSGGNSDLIQIWLSRLRFRDIEISNYKAGKEVDWTNAVYQKGFTQNYNVSISGRSDATNYYWSLGYVNNEGIMYNERFKNIRTRINLDSDITSWLNVGINANFAVRDESPVTAHEEWLFHNSPYASYYEDDGETIKIFPAENKNAPHPHLLLLFNDRLANYNSLNSKLFGTIYLPYGFSFTTEYINIFNWNKEFNSYFSGNFIWALQGGMASRANNSVYNWQLNNILKWNKEFGKHVFNVTFLQNANKNQSWYGITDRRQFDPTDILGYHSLQSAKENRNIYTYDEVSTLDALLARLDYGFSSKYNVRLLFRQDGYSGFGQNNKRSNFGSGAFAWTMSEEAFYQIPWMNLLKIRASYGTNGNQGIGPYDALANLSSAKYILWNSSPEYVPILEVTRLANKELKWESTGAYNFGLDFSALKGRINGNIEAYYMITRDLLITRQLPDVTGFRNILSNIGQVDNKGFEFALNTINVSKMDFLWSSNFSLAHNRSKIVHLFGDTRIDSEGNVVEVDDITNEWFIGEAIDRIWDYKILGVWQESEKEEAAMYSREPGDFKLLDVNNDYLYTNEDKQFQGYKNPKFRLTLRNDIKYKNWDFSIKGYSYLGYYQPNNQKKNSSMSYWENYYNVPRWTSENPINDWARLESFSSGFDVWENSSFIRIDNITLSYNFPQSILDKFKIVSSSISLIAQNPFIWMPKWTWGDVEAGNSREVYHKHRKGLAFTNYSLRLKGTSKNCFFLNPLFVEIFF